MTAPPEGVPGSVAPGAVAPGAPGHGHDAVDGLEARPAPVTSAPAPETVSTETVGTVGSVGSADAATAGDFVVPDYPPDEALLPPAPTSPTVSTVPFDTASVVPAPAPLSPIDAAPRAPVTPAVPVVGQPRFSVPGLEHVVVEGTEPEPVGPIGYRTPARFAHQRPAVTAPTTATAPASSSLAPTRAFDALITPSAPAPAPTAGPTPASTAGTATASNAAGATTAAGPTALVGASVVAATGLQVEAKRSTAGATPIGPTPGAVLGAVAGLATLGLAAWWFLAPATVHGVGVALGVIAVLVSVVTLRNPAATWQRPVALLGAVLGGVGTLVLLWAVASALLPMAGVTLPDVTGAGVVPTLAP